METTIKQESLSILLVNAFRYCLGRRSYAVSEFVGILTPYWPSLNLNWQRLIQEEIRDAIKKGWAGDPCDVQTWEKVLALPLTPLTN